MGTTLFDNALALYDRLSSVSEIEKMDGIHIPVFRGSIVDAFDAVGISRSRYTPVMDALKQLGCFTVIASGRRSKPTIIALHHPPDEVEFMILHTGDLTGSPEAAKLRSRFERMEKAIGGINIADALTQLEARVAQLERSIKHKEKE